MNNKNDHILRQLRDFEMKAPGELWDILCRKLFEDDARAKTEQVKDFSLNPPDELYNDIEKKIEEFHLQNNVSPVKDAEIKPANNLFESITAAIGNETKKTRGRVLTPFFKRTLLLAASVTGILLFSIYFKDLFFPKKDLPADIVTKIKQQEPGSNNDTLHKFAVSEPLVHNATHKEQPAAVYRQPLKPKQFLDVRTVYLNGKKILITNNDLLYSFAGYNYTTGKKYFPETNRMQEITIDGFGNISVSPYVYSVISDLYKVKRNGHLTRKAKRAKVKIEKWRKQDVQLFDKKLKYNPLDIIDLAETVYKK